MLSTELMRQQVIPLFISPKGRISRGLFWKANLVLWLGFIILVSCVMIFKEVFRLSDGFQDNGFSFAFLLYFYAAFVLTIKRLHDINWSGWLAIPCILTGILWLIIGLIAGTSGKNKHGENPVEYERNRLDINREIGLPPPPPPLDNPISKIVLYAIIISFVPSLAALGMVIPDKVEKPVHEQTEEQELPFDLQKGDQYQKVEAQGGIDAYYIVTRTDGTIEHYALDGTLQWSNVEHEEEQVDESAIKLNFIHKVYADKFNDDLLGVDIIKLHASSNLKQLILKSQEIANQEDEPCDWMREYDILIQGQDYDTRLEDMQFIILDNGLVRTDFENFGEKHQVDFDIQCDGQECKIDDVYEPSSYKQELQKIVQKGVCSEPLLLQESVKSSDEYSCIVSDPTGTPLNVRSSPPNNIKYEKIITSLPNGTFVRKNNVTHVNGNRWINVVAVDSNDNTIDGWVLGEYIHCDKKANSDIKIVSYNAYIDNADLHNSTGQRLTKVWQIIQQDRANFHKFNIRQKNDDYDNYFLLKQNRDNIKGMVKNGKISEKINNIIIRGNINIYVEVYENKTIGNYIAISIENNSPS